MTKTITASEFKVKCLALMDEVARTGKGVVITKNGKPIADLVPHRPQIRNARGILKGQLIVTATSFLPSRCSGMRLSKGAK